MLKLYYFFRYFSNMSYFLKTLNKICLNDKITCIFVENINIDLLLRYP
jgi:hypothetical protein